MYAIFRAKGKQFRAVEDAVLRLPTLEAEPGDKLTFDDVLLAEREGDIHVGAPSLKGASVAVEVLAHGRGEKIIVYKMKRRKGYRRKQGHRQGYTEIRIVGIEFPKGKPKRPEAKAAAEPAAEKAPPAEKKAAKPVPDVEEAVAETPLVEEPAAEATEAPAVDVAPETKAPAEESPAPEAEAIDITDVARGLAEAHGLDLGALEGTGKGGRILKSDVDQAIKAKGGD